MLMQERGGRDGDHLVLNRMVRPGDNIRRRGEDIAEGEQLLFPGERLDARHVALLAAQRRRHVRVRRRPRVGIVSTGNELRQPGSRLDEAAIYDSNRPMIITLAEQAGVEVLAGGWVRDDAAVMAKALSDLGPVGMRDSHPCLVVIQALDGTILPDRRPMGEDGAALSG